MRTAVAGDRAIGAGNRTCPAVPCPGVGAGVGMSVYRFTTRRPEGPHHAAAPARPPPSAAPVTASSIAARTRRPIAVGALTTAVRGSAVDLAWLLPVLAVTAAVLMTGLEGNPQRIDD